MILVGSGSETHRSIHRRWIMLLLFLIWSACCLQCLPMSLSLVAHVRTSPYGFNGPRWTCNVEVLTKDFFLLWCHNNYYGVHWVWIWLVARDGSGFHVVTLLSLRTKRHLFSPLQPADGSIQLSAFQSFRRKPTAITCVLDALQLIFVCFARVMKSELRR